MHMVICEKTTDCDHPHCVHKEKHSFDEYAGECSGSGWCSARNMNVACKEA